MVTGYARWLSARLIPSRPAEDLFAGWWHLLHDLGGIPRMLVWDGEGAIGKRRRRVTVLTEAAHAFRGVLGAKILICDPADPKAKGLVERANGYLETSFLPGRRFASPTDFNTQLTDWLALANQRHRRALAARPPTASRPTAPACCHCPGRAGDGVAAGTAAPTRSLRASGRQRLLGPPSRRRPPGRGHRRLDRIRVHCDGDLVADHARCWARHQTISDPAHLRTARALRTAYRLMGREHHDPAGVEVRRLAGYDHAFGLDGVDHSLDGADDGQVA